MKRETWTSKVGFIFAAAGSAVGLANIWRFPYLVGSNGGGAFIVVYLLCLLLIGFPVFVSEALIGRAVQRNPAGAFRMLGGTRYWGWAGILTIITGFIVSAFYSSVAAWILGYLVESVLGNIHHFASSEEAALHYASLLAHPYWNLSYHFLFLAICTSILYFGVQHGIERGNKFMVPLLYIVLIILVIQGLSMPKGWEGITFLFSVDWKQITPFVVLTALGQAFFTLSLGQGTMVTYGSYLRTDDNMLSSCFPVAVMDTVVSFFAAIAVFSIVFSAGMEPNAGPSLLFRTLPVVFSSISAGYLIAIFFFLLVFLAAATSQISAMEPTIAYLIDEHGWKRHVATLTCGCGSFLLGIPCALSTNLLKDYLFFNKNILEIFDFTATALLIPLGGFFAIILTGWVWGIGHAIANLRHGAEETLDRYPIIAVYFRVCFRYISPILIIFVFLNAIGLFG